MNGLYTIESVRRRDGSVHEREARRKGHRVRIGHIGGDAPLRAEYVDEPGAVLHTSPVSDWVRTDSGKLVVWTGNSVYTFRKIDEEVAD